MSYLNPVDTVQHLETGAETYMQMTSLKNASDLKQCLNDTLEHITNEYRLSQLLINQQCVVTCLIQFN